MEPIAIPTAFGTELHLQPVSFPRRLLAWALDGVVIFLYLVVSAWALQRLAGWLHWDEGSPFLRTLTLVLFFFPALVYHPLFEWAANGQTPGKMMTGVRVTDAGGGRVSPGQSLIRWIIRTSDYTLILLVAYAPGAMQAEGSVEWKLLAALLLLLADLYLVNTGPRRQRLGDRLAGTVLIRLKLQPRLDATVFRPVPAGYAITFPEAARLSDEELNLLQGLSEMLHRSGNEALAERTGRKIRSMLDIESDLPPKELVEVVLRDAYAAHSRPH